MRFLNHMNEKQASALRDLRDGAMTMTRWRKKHGLDGKRLARWMRNRFFRCNLRAMLREGRRIRELTLEMNANHAAQQFDRLASGLVSMSALETDQNDRMVEQGRKNKPAVRSRKRGRRVVLEDRDLCHPDAKAEEEELRAILAGE